MVPSSDHAPKCFHCGNPTTEDEKFQDRIIECSGECCENIAHLACVEVCDSCGWFCKEEYGEYYECDSCEKIHYPSDIVSLGSGFQETFGCLCYSCFYYDEETQERKTQKPKFTSFSRCDSPRNLSHFVGRAQDAGTEVPLENLIEIINKCKIKANHTGYYSSYFKGAPNYDLSKAVCFTEARLDALIEQSKKFGVFCISFGKTYLIKDYKCSPAIYLPTSILEIVRDVIPKELVPFVNKLEPGRCDFHHEREWRTSEDFQFGLDKIQAIFCPLHNHPTIRSKTNYKGPLFCFEKLSEL